MKAILTIFGIAFSSFTIVKNWIQIKEELTCEKVSSRMKC